MFVSFSNFHMYICNVNLLTWVSAMLLKSITQSSQAWWTYSSWDHFWCSSFSRWQSLCHESLDAWWILDMGIMRIAQLEYFISNMGLMFCWISWLESDWVLWLLWGLGCLLGSYGNLILLLKFGWNWWIMCWIYFVLLYCVQSTYCSWNFMNMKTRVTFQDPHQNNRRGQSFLWW